jgi:hypothetical protein
MLQVALFCTMFSMLPMMAAMEMSKHTMLMMCRAMRFKKLGLCLALHMAMAVWKG